MRKSYLCCQCNELDAVFVDLKTGEFLCKECLNERKKNWKKGDIYSCAKCQKSCSGENTNFPYCSKCGGEK